MQDSVAGIKAPFPWFGGKTLAAPLIWQALGDVSNYVEPFAGSLAVLLNRPHAPQIETVNDKDALLVNVWRALQADPDGVVQWCDFPVNEAQQHAVHTWLVGQKEAFTARLMGDPDYYDVKVAGRWLYGIGCWIGSGWCSGNGPWQSVDGQLVYMGNRGQGVHRQRVHLGDAGQGVHRQHVHLGTAGQGGLTQWFTALQQRLRYVRVCCGDWTRVLGPSVTYNCHKAGMLTAIYLDPPYSKEEHRDPTLYTVEDLQVAHAVREWCLANGDNPLLRIVFSAYGEVHDALLTHGWRKRTWTTNGGYGNLRKDGSYQNKYREVLYFSPHTLMTDSAQQLGLFPSHPSAHPAGPAAIRGQA
jgi:hypothetical protein